MPAGKRPVRRAADGVRRPEGGATVPRRQRQGCFHPINDIGHEKVYGRLSREGGLSTPRGLSNRIFARPGPSVRKALIEGGPH